MYVDKNYYFKIFICCFDIIQVKLNLTAWPITFMQRAKINSCKHFGLKNNTYSSAQRPHGLLILTDVLLKAHDSADTSEKVMFITSGITLVSQVKTFLNLVENYEPTTMYFGFEFVFIEFFKGLYAVICQTKSIFYSLIRTIGQYLN